MLPKQRRSPTEDHYDHRQRPAEDRPKNEELTFEEVVALAFENPPTGDGIQYTVQYTRGHGNKPAGTLVEGQSVKVKGRDGIRCHVDQSLLVPTFSGCRTRATTSTYGAASCSSGTFRMSTRRGPFGSDPDFEARACRVTRPVKPKDHVAYWTGEHPCHSDGSKITRFENLRPAGLRRGRARRLHLLGEGGLPRLPPQDDDLHRPDRLARRRSSIRR